MQMADVTTENQESFLEKEWTPEVGTPGPKPKRRKKKTVKRIITILIILLVIGGIVFGMFKLFKKPEVVTIPQTEFVYRGSLQSTVTGNGVTKAKSSASVVLPSGGMVLEVFVAEGDWVNKGDPLYIIDSADAQKAVDDAQKTIDNIDKQMAEINGSYGDLIVSAPFTGKLYDTLRLQQGDFVSAGTKIAKLVDDAKLLLTLYFSYAYEGEIYVNKDATVSIPSLMNEIPGRVKEVNMIRRITPEGSVLFSAVIEVTNPGTLAAEMSASAVLKDSFGEDIYPYDAGVFEFNRVSDVVTKTSGNVISARLMDYAQVTGGQTLLSLDGGSNDEQIEALERQREAAEAVLKKAQDNLTNFNAVAPLDGTVVMCSLIVGEEAETGRAAVSISNTSVIMIDAQIDEMNITYVKAGMYCQIEQWGRNGQEYFDGIVDSVSMEGKYENGISYFPAVIRVENTEGNLMPGMNVGYNLIAAQADDCLLVSLVAVKYTEAGTCLFVKLDERPEEALDAAELGLDIPEGFYAVPVVIGLSDYSQAEVVSGVDEGAEVLTQIVESSDEPGMDMGGGGGGVVVMRG
jgi:multidrug resistance efflux pump